MLSQCHRGYYSPFCKHFDSMHTNILQIRQRGKILLSNNFCFVFVVVVFFFTARSKYWFIFTVIKTEFAKFSQSVKTNLNVCKTARSKLWTRTHQYLTYHNKIVCPPTDAPESRILKDISQMVVLTDL